MVPLALVQMPNLVVSAMSAEMLGRVGGAAAAVRVAGLALPVMAGAVPIGALLARRHRGWPALLAGLILIGAGDLLGDSARTLLMIGVDRGVHGLGAGLALGASLAVAWERDGRWRRVLARWWVVVVVIGLLGAVPLMRDRLTGGHWRAALQPFPWLTAAALAATAIYVLATGGSGPPARAAVTPAERSQLALLAVPVAGLGALAVGVSEQRASSALVAAGVAVLVLAGLALMASADPVTGGREGRRSPGRLCFPVAGACAGFVLAPTAGAIGALRALPGGPDPALRALGLPLGVAAGGCVLAAFAAALVHDRTAAARAGVHAGAHAARRGSGGELRLVLLGLACAAAGLLAVRAAGPNGSQAALAVGYGLLGGGMALALSTAICGASAAGAMSGLSLTVAGALTGYLTAGAIQVRMISAAAPVMWGNASVGRVLTEAAGRCELIAAGAAVAAAAGVFLLGRARREPGEVTRRG